MLSKTGICKIVIIEKINSQNLSKSKTKWFNDGNSLETFIEISEKYLILGVLVKNFSKKSHFGHLLILKTFLLYTTEFVSTSPSFKYPYDYIMSDDVLTEGFS